MNRPETGIGTRRADGDEFVRSQLAAIAILAALSSPACAGWSLAYAPETNLERLDVSLIDRARSSIDMAAYVLTDVAVIDALTRAAGRGVHVRIYRDGGQDEVGQTVADHLFALRVAPGVEVRTKAGRVFMHLKSYAVDGRILRGGAANFSASGLKQQDNDRFETDDSTAVQAFKVKFDAMWAGGRS